MEHPSNSNPGEPDDDPDIPKMKASTPSENYQKSRVRFNSNAGTTTPAVPPAAITHDQTKAPRRPHPILRSTSKERTPTVLSEQGVGISPTRDAAFAAQHRGHAMARTVWEESPTSSRASFESISPSSSGSSEYQLLSNAGEIAMQRLGHGPHSRHESTDFDASGSKDDLFKDGHCATNSVQHLEIGSEKTTADGKKDQPKPTTEFDGIYDTSYDGTYNVPPPNKYRGGVLSQLLKLHKGSDAHSPRNNQSASSSKAGTGATTPDRRKWYDQNTSQDTLATLIEASTKLAKPAQPQSDGKKPRTQHKRNGSIANRLSALWTQEETHVRGHIADTLARQSFILKVCRALMLYGAPTHRLEEYLIMTARALEIEAQFLYIPGCMVIAFDDASTHTTEVKLVRLAQGIDLGKLKDVHRIYKEVIHDVTSVEEATGNLDELMAKKAKFHPWLRVLVFGLTSLTASPFSFHARFIDLPLCFLFGCLVGMLQLIVAPMSPLYSNVLEVTATVVVSFLARAFGSIRGGDLFCFSALAQGGIVMLLPGYMFLSSSLELQARAIVPGSIRIVYGVIYSLLLGFGITIGSALYGLIDSNATSELTCSNPPNSLLGLIFVPFFVLCITMLYQAKWKQMPTMIIIASAGYIVNYYSSLKFPTSPQISSTLGAFAVGALANLYSRARHGVAAAILIPAIFTQVPGGLASNGGLLSGLQVANEINNASYAPNGTSYAQLGVSIGTSPNYVAFNVAGSMIQIAIGITIGLFLSALVVYPLGKKRSGLFSF